MDTSPYRIAPDDWQRLLSELGVDARSSAPRAASPRHQRRASSEASGDDTPREPWAIALRRAGRLGPALGDGRWAVLCPNDHQHSNPDGSAEAAGGSCVLLPAGEGRLFGRPHCSHAHCASLTLADWIHCVGAVVYADSIAEARGWRVARGYVMTPWGVFEAKRKPLALPKADAAPDAAEPPLAADAPAEGGELGSVVAAEEPFQWAPGDALCNFSARLTLDVEEHAPEETRRAFELTCMVGGAQQVIRIPAEEYPGMSWVSKRLGSEAVIEAGRDTKDRLRAAIQHLSLPVPKKAVFTCTGWRAVGGREAYLSSSGGLGADGPVAGVEVQLAAPLRPFSLPAPIEGSALGTALERAAELFLLSASGPAVALFGAVWRAPLGYSPLVVYLSGAPEAGKTYLAAIAQSFYGAGWSEKRLPASLKHATALALNELRALARDCIFVVDDFVVTGTAEDVKQAEKVGLIARAQHGQHGRQGLTTAGRLDEGNDAVSSIPIITGETLPRGHSLRSRLLVAELHQPMPESELLRDAARAGASGVFAGLMAAFLRWLAPRLPAARAELADRTARVVDKLSDGGKDHRALALLGEVGVGVGWFLEFAEAHGLRAELVKRVRDTAWRTLRELVAAQRASKAEQDPARRFVFLVADVLRSKRAHLTRPDGTPPADPHVWGWTVRPPIEPRRGDQEPIEQPPTPNGRCIGFIEGDLVWLYPEASLAEVQILARDNLDPLALAERDLGRRLHTGGFLAKHEMDNAQQSYLHRKRFRGRTLSGYCVKAEMLDGSGACVGAAVLDGRNGVDPADPAKVN
jgi:hypothetical protein